MSYQYDVFISYRRAYDWLEWVGTIFRPLLVKWLDLPSGDNAIFLDTRAESPGLPWPPALAGAMARSKLLLVLWTPNYYKGSHWCRTELDFILERERRSLTPNQSLVVPVILNNLGSLRADLDLRSPLDLSKYGNIRNKLSPGHEDLEAVVRDTLAPAIMALLRTVPEFDPAWDAEAQQAVAATVSETREAFQGKVPSLGIDPMSDDRPAA